MPLDPVGDAFRTPRGGLGKAAGGQRGCQRAQGTASFRSKGGARSDLVGTASPVLDIFNECLSPSWRLVIKATAHFEPQPRILLRAKLYLRPGLHL